MTREEMNLIRGFVTNIQSLKDAHINDNLPINYGMLCTITTKGWALLKELKALEQQSEDAISRQAVLDLVDSDWKYEGLETDIANLPPVTPRPKVGHWIWDCSIIPSTPVSPEEIDYCGWVCSECKQFPDDNDWDDPDEPPHYHYCPNCGCPMESEEE